MSLATLLMSCGKKDTTADSALKGGGRSTPASVQTNSFNQVASMLDPGGNFYLYMGTEQFLSGLSSKVSDFRQVVTSLPNQSTTDRANIEKLFGVLAGLVKSSGLEDISGVGASGVEIEKGVYLNKMMVHHYPGRSEGLMWSMFGKKPHPLNTLDYCPENTALAIFGDLDAELLWLTLKEQINKANIPELSKGLDEGLAEFERRFGTTLDKILGSLGGEMGLLLTLDGSKSIALPQGGGAKLEIPEPALALMLKVKDEAIYSQFAKALEANPQIIKTEKAGVKMLTMALPAPFITLRFSVARYGDYLFISSNDKTVNDMIAAKKGDAKGLKDSAEFKAKSKGIALEGNSFTYVSPEISRTINHVVSSIADAQAAAGRKEGLEFLDRLLGEGRESFSFSVASNTKEGWFMQGRSSQHPALAFLGPTMIAPAAIIAGMTLPAMAKAKDRAQSINCVNNLKQIGLAARMYANDHAEVLPKDFEAMKNELGSPRVLFCPGDPKKNKPVSWTGFNFADVSYEFVSPGARTDDPQKVLARCPIHNNICLVDGSVQQQGRSTRRPRPR